MTNLKAREALVPEGGLDPFDAAHDELKMEAGRRSNRIVTEGVEGSMAWLGSLYHVFVSNRVKVAPGTGICLLTHCFVTKPGTLTPMILN